jgi:acetyl-CoA carboxylase biotin carboxylase subunit
VDDAGAYFMEMNARIQVEHPVTEVLTGVDLVREQLLVAGGRRLQLQQEDVVPRGAAIECRINAEDPARGFAPAPGHLDVLRAPGGPWTRFDTGYRQGDDVSPYYDSLLGKLIVWAPDRDQAIRRMDRALAELRVEGPGLRTTVDLHRALLRHPDVRADRHDIEFLDRCLPDLVVRAAALDSSPAGALPPHGPLQLVPAPSDQDPPGSPVHTPLQEGTPPCPTRRSPSRT